MSPNLSADATNENIYQRVGYGTEVAKLYSGRSACISFVRGDWDLKAGCSFVEEAGDQVGLVAEAMGVRVPAHDIAAFEDGESVVVV
jgi:hypothetical protein